MTPLQILTAYLAAGAPIFAFALAACFVCGTADTRQDAGREGGEGDWVKGLGAHCGHRSK